MSEPTSSRRYQQGMATRRQVLGDAHVDKAMAQADELDAPFQELITEAAWGHAWSRPGWSHRERSMVTIALLAALGHEEELAMHVRATARTGVSREDVCEAMMQVAIYAGVPAANRALKVAKEAYRQMQSGRADGETTP